MDIDTVMNDEYEIEHYELFNTTYFIKSFKSSMVNRIKVIFSTIQKAALETASGEEIEEIINNFQEYEEKYIDSIKVPLDNLKPIARKFFQIPENIVLTDIQYINDTIDINALKQKEAELEHYLLQQKAYNTVLDNELIELESLNKYKELIATSIETIHSDNKFIEEEQKELQDMIQSIYEYKDLNVICIK